MLQSPSPISRDQRIRDEFVRVGPMSTNAFAHHLVAVGFYSDEDLVTMHIRAIQAEARKALKQPDEAGLPFAGQTTKEDDGGTIVWMMRQLWDFDDYSLNVKELVGQRDTLHWQAARLADECRDRFGHAPTVPPIGGLSMVAD